MLYPVELRAQTRGERSYFPPVTLKTLNYKNFNSGRGGGIRTHDPLLPKQMRYQAALRPEEARILQTELHEVNPMFCIFSL